MNIVFMGTPAFAVPSLNVVAEDHTLVSVVTQPDRAKGRGHKVQVSPVKERALQLPVPVHQPKSVQETWFQDTLAEESPDAIVVVAFGQKIPAEMLDLPPRGCINVHGSLLPEYRGAAPIHRAIADGRDTTGVTTMYMSEDWDAGDIILQKTIPIRETDTAGTLHDRMMHEGAELLRETLRQIEAGTAPRVPQDHSQATYAFRLRRGDGEIDWTQSAQKLECFIRGMTPWPSAFTYFRGETIKVRQASVLPGEGTPGEVQAVDEHGIIVGTGSGLLRLEEVQRPGSTWIPGKDAANGLRIQPGDEFGHETA